VRSVEIIFLTGHRNINGLTFIVGLGVTGAFVGEEVTGEEVTGEGVPLGATVKTKSSLSSHDPVEHELYQESAIFVIRQCTR
jgi:hypothetical protein